MKLDIDRTGFIEGWDNLFDDLNVSIEEHYPIRRFTSKTIKTTYRAICNKCDSDDCLVIPIIEEIQ